MNGRGFFAWFQQLAGLLPWVGRSPILPDRFNTGCFDRCRFRSDKFLAEWLLLRVMRYNVPTNGLLIFVRGALILAGIIGPTIVAAIRSRKSADGATSAVPAATHPVRRRLHAVGRRPDQP